MNSEIKINDLYALTSSPDAFIDALEELCKEYCGASFSYEYNRNDPDHSVEVIRVNGSNEIDPEEKYWANVATHNERHAHSASSYESAADYYDNLEDGPDLSDME